MERRGEHRRDLPGVGLVLLTAMVALIRIPVSSMNWDPMVFGMTINPLILNNCIGIVVAHLSQNDQQLLPISEGAV